VDDRAALIGRYETEDGREAWTLADDGTCRIERAGASVACEWVVAERDGEASVVVTVATPPHRTQYVLTARRLPWGRVTMPLGAAELRKVAEPDVRQVIPSP
jgi:hypothetical protein